MAGLPPSRPTNTGKATDDKKKGDDKKKSDKSSDDKKKTDEKKIPDEDDDLDPSLVSVYDKSVTPTSLSLVVVHPLVLLSVVDHYNRVAKDTSKRVVGVLLGETYKGKVDVTNSYAVPFEEDPKDASAWYIDRQYHEDMYAMFKKVNASEKVVGWYSTGPKLRTVDLSIHELFRSYCSNPILVIIDVNPRTSPLEIPTLAYTAIEAKPNQQLTSRRQFQHLPSEIGAYEAEEVGVEHLLRNIRDHTESSLAEQVHSKIISLKALQVRLHEIIQYLTHVQTKKLPVNHAIIAQIQDIFNLLPDLSQPSLLTALTLAVNDHSMVIYVASLIRSILALHDLIQNKISNKRIEAEEAEKAKDSEKEKKDTAGKSITSTTGGSSSRLQNRGPDAEADADAEMPDDDDNPMNDEQKKKEDDDEKKG